MVFKQFVQTPPAIEKIVSLDALTGALSRLRIIETGFDFIHAAISGSVRLLHVNLLVSYSAEPRT